MHRSSSSVAAVNSIERDRKKFWRKLRPSLFSNLFSSLFVFPSSFSLFLVSFVFLYARSVIRISLRFLDRFILHLSFHLFPFFSIFFLHVPFFPALAHYRKLEVTRERGILMYTVELRCSRKKGEREGGREGELQSAPNRWRIQCCFLPRREARLLERRRRLTFDPLLLPLSLLAPPLFGHPLHKPIVFFLFARKSASFVFTSFIGKKKY